MSCDGVTEPTVSIGLEKPGVDSRDEGKHTGRNDLLLVEKMMWM